MRPKVVILILVLAFGMLGLIAVLKGVKGNKSSDGTVPPTGSETAANPAIAETNNPALLGNNFGAATSSNNAASLESMRAVVIQKELEAITEIFNAADGTNNATIIIPALIDKVLHPEAAVRQAALEALKQLDDTNAVPGLEKAQESIKDPHGKVAVLDTIDYLKLPSVSADAPADYKYTPPDPQSIPRHTKMNPNFKPNGKKNAGANNAGQQPAPADAPASQPQ